MLKNIIYVTPLKNYRLKLRFEDGVEGEVDLEKFLKFEGVFEPLKKWAFFIQVDVNAEIGTVYWPNGADLDPDVLYSEITGQPIPSFADLIPSSLS